MNLRILTCLVCFSPLDSLLALMLKLSCLWIVGAPYSWPFYLLTACCLDSCLLSSVTKHSRIIVYLSCPDLESAISPRRPVSWTPAVFPDLPLLPSGSFCLQWPHLSSSLESCPWPLEVLPNTWGMEGGSPWGLTPPGDPHQAKECGRWKPDPLASGLTTLRLSSDPRVPRRSSWRCCRTLSEAAPCLGLLRCPGLPSFSLPVPSGSPSLISHLDPHLMVCFCRAWSERLWFLWWETVLFTDVVIATRFLLLSGFLGLFFSF